VDVVASIIAIVALIGLFVFVRRRSAQENVRPVVQRRPGAAQETKFHAVSIKFGPKACSTAREMEGRRFLSSAAPRIPLPECDSMECSCRFVHHKDRRAGRDRRNPWGQGLGTSGTGNYRQEQRNGGDRRKEDEADGFFH
jgi:hypothetical protein